jgi:hypothetical protein
LSSDELRMRFSDEVFGGELNADDRVRSHPAHRRNAASSAYSEIGAAAMVDPDASAIVAPTVALLAPRIASLPGHLHTALRIDRAGTASTVVGRAADLASAAIVSTIVRFIEAVHDEVRTATVIYPDASLIVAPTVALLAGGSAALIGHLHAAPCIDRTGMPSTVVGRTGNGLATRVPSIVPIASVAPTVDHEIGAAAVVHPDALAVVAPAIALLTGCSAALIGHLHAAPCIHRAGVASAIVGRTGDGLATPIPSVVPTVHHEVGAATVVYPDALAVVAPAITLLAGGSAALIGHLYASPRINMAGMPSTVIG